MELEVRNKLELSIEIHDIFAREILDFAGNPAIEVEVLAGTEIVGKASVCATAVEEEVEVINSRIAPALIGANGFAQHEIDKLLEETGGSSFVVSLAVARAAASAEQISFCRYLGGVRAVHPKIPILLDQEEWNQRKEAQGQENQEQIKEIKIRSTDTLTNLFQRILQQQNEGVKILLMQTDAGTEDSFPADLAVAANLPMICVENRQSAYYTVLSNRLQQLEEKLRG